jgi:hypothetical protein
LSEFNSQDEIQIPTVFVSRWESVLVSQKYGWIKDPAGNYIRIDLSGIVQQNMIPGGLFISQRCGFVAPQRVFFCYQVLHHQFNMKIVNDEGLDIPYFGFHYPTNHHAMRLADPTYVPPVCCVSVVDSPDEDGEVAMLIPYDMFKDFFAAYNAGGSNQVPGHDDPVQHIPGGDGKPEEYLWTLTVNEAVAAGSQVLVRVTNYVNVLSVYFDIV